MVNTGHTSNNNDETVAVGNSGTSTGDYQISTYFCKEHQFIFF